MRQRGFTLLEMIIGITLLGFILMLLYGGLRLGTRSWDAGEEAVAVSSRQSAVDGFLRRQLALVYPLRWRTENGEEALAFEGESESLLFAASLPARLGAGGVHLLALEGERDGDTGLLKLKWRQLDPEQKGFEFPAEGDQVRLVQDIESLKFGYFGAENKDEEPSWQDTWHSETQLPQIIRLQVKPKVGAPWPDILVAPKLGTESACRWDDFYKRCM